MIAAELWSLPSSPQPENNKRGMGHKIPILCGSPVLDDMSLFNKF